MRTPLQQQTAEAMQELFNERDQAVALLQRLIELRDSGAFATGRAEVSAEADPIGRIRAEHRGNVRALVESAEKFLSETDWSRV